MLRQHSQVMITLLVIADAVAVAAAWLGSYYLRFHYLPVDPEKGVPALSDRFLPMLPLVVLGHLIIFSRLRLYRPRRSDSLARELRDILKAFVVAIVVVVVLDYAQPETNKISRQFIATYAVLGTGLFALFRMTVRLALRLARRQGWNRRYAAIVGTGRTAQRLAQALRRHKWIGMEVAYFVDDAVRDPTATLHGTPMYGPLARLTAIVDAHPVDSVFIALPAGQAEREAEVLDALETCLADVRLVPHTNPAHTLRLDVARLDDLPILSLRQSPLQGWSAIVKRGFDVVVGSACLLIAVVPMLVIAVLIKASSRGPVLYRQKRMTFDGQPFMMLKFRTMRTDAEADGPQWSRTEDPRRTRIGALLRRTSLDELPNLLNVLAGQMSLVGPRPERPEFIRSFKHEIPQYMMRHKIKAGMTGYAQVRGWRGDTSLRKRIQHDLHYIRNWSLGLDVRILLQTLVGVWLSGHEEGGRRPAEREVKRATGRIEDRGSRIGGRGSRVEDRGVAAGASPGVEEE